MKHLETPEQPSKNSSPQIMTEFERLYREEKAAHEKTKLNLLRWMCAAQAPKLRKLANETPGVPPFIEIMIQQMETFGETVIPNENNPKF